MPEVTDQPSGRPMVSVIMPFHGSAEDAREALAAISAIALREGDEAIVADNTAEGHMLAVAAEASSSVRVFPARYEQSSYYSRNVGAENATGEWLLFTDADCRPPADLIELYFSEPIDDDVGAVAGPVVGVPEQEGLVPRYARSRGHLNEHHAHSSFRPAGVTANMLVRRKAWASVGGFFEGIRSGGDTEFSWRIQDAGWKMGFNEKAVTEHYHRTSVKSLVRQASRYKAGNAWLNRRYPGTYPRPRLIAPLARSAAGIVVWTVTLRFERALFKAIDGLWVSAEFFAYFMSNTPPPVAGAEASEPRADGQMRVCVLVDEYAKLSETFVASEVQGLMDLGHRIRVESGARPARYQRAAARAADVSFWEDDGLARKAAALTWLVARHPLRALRDRRDCRRWAQQEDVWSLLSLARPAQRIIAAGDEQLHAQFAGTNALNTMRLSRLLGLPYSVTAHAYEIFRNPNNLTEKLAGTTFCTTASEFSVRALGELIPEVRDRLQLVSMGIDTDVYRRTTPPPGGRSVLAVGRMVEKKGFPHLIDAVAALQNVSLTFVGDGPMRAELEQQARERGIDVNFLGAMESDGVRAQLEATDVLAIPAILAADGDRDSLPLIAQEALSMEVPVIASEAFGLPEVVRPEWGRLVPSGDVQALAAAIAELLDMTPDQRAALGAAGREHVLQVRSVQAHARRIAELLAAG